MSYDDYKLATPETYGTFEMSEKCKCGGKKNLCDSFCAECQKGMSPSKVTPKSL